MTDFDREALRHLAEDWPEEEDDRTCDRCHGKGEVEGWVDSGLGGWWAYLPCPDCEGKGHV